MRDRVAIRFLIGVQGCIGDILNVLYPLRHEYLIAYGNIFIQMIKILENSLIKAHPTVFIDLNISNLNLRRVLLSAL